MRNPSYVANGNIPVSCFVKLVAGTDHRIELAGAGTIAIGVAHEGPMDAMIPPYTNDATPQYAAIAGTACRVYGPGESCEVIAGAIIGAGAFLKPNASGHAIVAAAGESYSAIARAGATAIGQKLQVIIEHGRAV